MILGLLCESASSSLLDRSPRSLEVISIPFPNDRLDFEIKFMGWGKEQADSDNRDKEIKKDIEMEREKETKWK